MLRQMLLVVAVGFLLAADAPKDEAKKEHEKLQGDWIMVAGERNGQKLSEAQVKLFKRTSKGDQFTVMQGDTVFSKGTFTLDPTKKPKTIDIMRSEDKDKPILGIYELDGDTYKVCYGAPGKERPTEFTAKEGSGHTYSMWKREKK